MTSSSPGISGTSSLDPKPPGGGGIPTDIFTAEGSLITSSAANIPVELLAGTPGDVLTMGATEPEWDTPSGGNNSIPIADVTGIFIDNTTYDNPVTGTGKLTTIVFPTDTVGIAFAVEGDAFPRLLILSDPTDEAFAMGDGTIDPYGDGATIRTDNTQAFVFSSGGGIRSTSPIFNLVNLPTDDPHNAGDLWSNLGIVTVSAG